MVFLIRISNSTIPARLAKKAIATGITTADPVLASFAAPVDEPLAVCPSDAAPAGRPFEPEPDAALPEPLPASEPPLADTVTLKVVL
ncbi:hypothetical protein [Bifidobacterium sp.]|uniref:hypothetical protein n=1 Tax=Bifidobacterium sp. TaxID=41200 RepID=UPI0025C59A44|nr:hypothetical protein [Bifidobacterium sp.]MCH4209905.1 hypothetical protein [Bifidobacterium sp.]